MRKVVITGFGAVTPHGLGHENVFSAILAGRSAISNAPPTVRQYLPRAIAAVVPKEVDAAITDHKLGPHDRATQFALLAGDEAVANARLYLDQEQCKRTGVAVGTSTGGAVTLDSGYKRLYKEGHIRLPPGSITRSMVNGPAAWLSMRYGLRASSLTYCTACSSSAAALGESYRLIKHGYVDAMLVVGAEAMLAPGPFLAWHALHVLAPQREDAPEESCRPFSADRSGLVLGEGAVAIVLESADTARDREVTPLAEFVGYGTTCDAHHLTKPASSGQISAMRQAIADAEVDIAEIGYVNAHGTATRAGDTIEAESLNALFKDCIRFPLVSATKSMHGHLLGASGALEFMLTVLAVQNDSVPPTLHLNDVDPLLAGIDFVPHKARKVNKLEVAMSNSFAFGGANVSLLVRKWDRPMDIPENKSRQQNSRAELGSGRASRA